MNTDVKQAVLWRRGKPPINRTDFAGIHSAPVCIIGWDLAEIAVSDLIEGACFNHGNGY